MTGQQLPQLVAAGLSDTDLGELFGVHPRTVSRWRADAGLASSWTPTRADHGSPARYNDGCTCSACLVAHAQRVQAYRDACQERTRYAPNHLQPWSLEDDALLLDESAGTVLERACQLGRTYLACVRRLARLQEQQREEGASA